MPAVVDPAMTDLSRRALSLTTLETIKNAYSSPSACIHANWCRIPMAIVIAIAALILFTCFCCWANCIACCCCTGKSKKRRSALDNEYSASRSGLLPQSNSFAQASDLPAMPSYKMDEMKKPTYAIIGDDGSVNTEDPNKKLAQDFPPDIKDEKKDPFSNANDLFHNPASQQNSGYSTYNEPARYSDVPAYAPSAQSYKRMSPPRRFQPGQDYPLQDPQMFQNTRLPRNGREFANAQQDPETKPRPAFNEGPFPLMNKQVRQPSPPRTTYQPHSSPPKPYQPYAPSSSSPPRAYQSHPYPQQQSPPKPYNAYNFSQRLPTRNNDYPHDPWQESTPYPNNT